MHELEQHSFTQCNQSNGQAMGAFTWDYLGIDIWRRHETHLAWEYIKAPQEELNNMVQQQAKVVKLIDWWMDEQLITLVIVMMPVFVSLLVGSHIRTG